MKLSGYHTRRTLSWLTSCVVVEGEVYLKIRFLFRDKELASPSLTRTFRRKILLDRVVGKSDVPVDSIPSSITIASATSSIVIGRTAKMISLRTRRINFISSSFLMPSKMRSYVSSRS
ncbi:uncharacterized protein LAJ45_10648 [Morchella importuna]|uniref:uncharacterized protein n=1 Tax=Morchella importuna TaxID=1174673 RepID=UPI001E8E06C0|nr:uncharacterized protein LAJ45_10648 [Morchella importuna]KAH8145365.1 hypothetical protein LAJ45_10648 [Morchella importuna]